MVATTASAFDAHPEMDMNRETWLNTHILESEDRNLGQGRFEYSHFHQHDDPEPRSPPREQAESQPFHSPHQHLGGPSHGAGNGRYNIYDASPFTDLASDPVARADQQPMEVDDDGGTGAGLDVVQEEDDNDRKPAAKNDTDHAIPADPFVGTTIKLSYSDDRTFDDENRNHGFDDFNAHTGMGDMTLLHHPMQDPLQAHAYPPSPWRPEYPSPVRSHSTYPPPPPRLQVYRFGGGESYMQFTPVQSLRHNPTRETPLALLPAPANAKRGNAKLKSSVFKRKKIVKQPKPNEAVSTPVVLRRPTHQELQEAKTPRAKAALNVWYDRLTDLVEYKAHNGDTNVPQKYDANPALGIWVNKQRMEKKFMDEGSKSSMTRFKLDALESIGFTWAKRKGQPSWDTRYAQLKEYHAQHGHCRVPTKYQQNPALGRWVSLGLFGSLRHVDFKPHHAYFPFLPMQVSTQRSQYKQFMENQPTHMTQDRKLLLEAIGFKWNAMLRGDEEDDIDNEVV